MFVLGLATSLHCIGMCGPMVVTYAVKGEEDGPWHKKLVPNLAYQGAKITSYVIVGLALGAIGSAFNLNGIRPWIMFAAGAFMIILGLGMTGKVPWAARLTPRPPKFLITSLSNLRRKAKTDADQGESTLATPVAFGLLTGLMPCAPLQGAEIAAAATGSVLLGGTAMLAFGLGTMPLMLAFGTASSFIPKDWKHRLSIMLAVVVMIFGLVFINRAAMLVGSPVTFNTVQNAVVGGSSTSSATPAAAYKTGADGVVEVPFSIINTKYVPDTVNIPADKPVRLLLDRQEDVACSDRLVIKQLGIDVALAPNAVTTINLPATPAGTYSMTCGMGMMSGQLVVGGASAGGSTSGSPLLWLLIAVVAGAGAVYLARRKPEPKNSARPAAKSGGKASAKKRKS